MTRRRAQAVRPYAKEPPEWAMLAAAAGLLAVALGVAMGVVAVVVPRLTGLVGRWW